MYKNINLRILILVVIVLLSGCATYYNPPTTGPRAYLTTKVSGLQHTIISRYENPERCQDRRQVDRFNNYLPFTSRIIENNYTLPGNVVNTLHINGSNLNYHYHFKFAFFSKKDTRYILTIKDKKLNIKTSDGTSVPIASTKKINSCPSYSLKTLREY